MDDIGDGREEVFDQSDDGYFLNCDGEAVSPAESGAFDSIRCECGWCSSGYWDRQYCVSGSRLRGWLESSCPDCGYRELHREGGWPVAVEVVCDGCGD